MSKDMNVILSLYPNTRGLGYVCIDMPQKLLDSGVITVKPIKNEQILRRVKTFIEFYQPKLIILRDCNASNSRCSDRISQLAEKIKSLAQEQHLPSFHYSRSQIKDAFELFGATTKYEIAMKIIEWFPELSIRAPQLRKPWMDEDYNMGIFDALALAVTHQHISK